MSGFLDTRTGIRTPVAAVKGRSPGPLDDTRKCGLGVIYPFVITK